MSNSNQTLTLVDVNLDSIQISSDGSCVNLSFIDMHLGEPVATLLCEGVIALNYHNTLKDDTLPCYVGEVEAMHMPFEQCESLLSRMGYGFLGAGVDMYRASNEDVWWTHVEGGEIEVRIVCLSVAVKRGK